MRPKRDYSYTNNWSPEPLVGNHVSADALVWSVLSLIARLGGTGILLEALRTALRCPRLNDRALGFF